MTCSVPTCERPARTRGWCASHYRRWQRHGDVHAALPIGGPTPIDADRVTRLYAAGATARGIARLLDTSPTTIFELLRHNDIPTRSPGRQPSSRTERTTSEQGPEKTTSKDQARTQERTTTPRHPDPKGAAAAAEERTQPPC
jgi:hypothetical protein